MGIRKSWFVKGGAKVKSRMKACMVTLCLMATVAAAPEKRQGDVVGDYFKESEKHQHCAAMATKGACDGCCDTTDFLYPYETATCHGLCWARPMTAGKRQTDVVGDYFKESEKHQHCAAMATKGACDGCCDTTDFLYPYETVTCHGL